MFSISQDVRKCLKNYQWSGEMMIKDIKRSVLTRQAFEAIPNRFIEELRKSSEFSCVNEFSVILKSVGPFPYSYVDSFDSFFPDIIDGRWKEASSSYYSLKGCLDFLRPSSVMESNDKVYAAKREALLEYSYNIAVKKSDDEKIEELARYMVMYEMEKLAANSKLFEIVDIKELEHPSSLRKGLESGGNVVLDFFAKLKKSCPDLDPSEVAEQIITYIDKERSFHMMDFFRNHFKTWFSSISPNLRSSKLGELLISMDEVQRFIWFHFICSENSKLRRLHMKDSEIDPPKKPILRRFSFENERLEHFFTAEIKEAIDNAHRFKKSKKRLTTSMILDKGDHVHNAMIQSEFEVLIRNEGLSSGDFEIVDVVIENTSSNTPTYLSSPTYSACVGVRFAYTRLSHLLLNDLRVLYALPLAKMSVLKSYINEWNDVFISEKENMYFVENDLIERLLERGYECLGPMLIPNYAGPFIGNNTITKEGIERQVLQMDAGKKFKSMKLYLDIAMKSVNSITGNDVTFFVNGLWTLALFSEFPKIAKTLHMQKQCEMFVSNCCLLDLCPDEMKKNIKRCQLPMLSTTLQYMTSIEKTFESHKVKPEENQNCSEKKKPVANRKNREEKKPEKIQRSSEKKTPEEVQKSSEEEKPKENQKSAKKPAPEPIKESSNNFLSGMKRGFFNSPKKDIPVDNKTGKSTEKDSILNLKNEKPSSISIAGTKDGSSVLVKGEKAKKSKSKKNSTEQNFADGSSELSTETLIAELGGIENMDMSVADLLDEDTLKRAVEEAKRLDEFPVLQKSKESSNSKNMESLKKGVEEPIKVASKASRIEEFCVKLREWADSILVAMPEKAMVMADFQKIVLEVLIGKLSENDMRCLNEIVEGEIEKFLIFQSNFNDLFAMGVRGKESKRYIRKRKNESTNVPPRVLPHSTIAHSVPPIFANSESGAEKSPKKKIEKNIPKAETIKPSKESTSGFGSNVTKGMSLSAISKFLSEKYDTKITVQGFESFADPMKPAHKSQFSKAEKNEEDKQKTKTNEKLVLKKTKTTPEKINRQMEEKMTKQKKSEATKETEKIDKNEVVSALPESSICVDPISEKPKTGFLGKTEELVPNADYLRSSEKEEVANKTVSVENEKKDEGGDERITERLDFETDSEEETGGKAEQEERGASEPLEEKKPCSTCTFVLQKALDDNKKIDKLELKLKHMEAEMVHKDLRMTREVEMLKLQKKSCEKESRQAMEDLKFQTLEKDRIISQLNEKVKKLENNMECWKEESERIFNETSSERKRAMEKYERSTAELQLLRNTCEELKRKKRSDELVLEHELELSHQKNEVLELLLDNATSSESDSVIEKLKEYGDYIRFLDEFSAESADALRELISSCCEDSNSNEIAEEESSKFVENIGVLRSSIMENLLVLVNNPESETLDVLKQLNVLENPFKLEEMCRMEKRLKQLPNAWHTVEQKKEVIELEDRECLICAVDIETNESVTKCEKCRRQYHSQCVSRWLQMNSICPVCRSALPDPNEFPSLK